MNIIALLHRDKKGAGEGEHADFVEQQCVVQKCAPGETQTKTYTQFGRSD